MRLTSVTRSALAVVLIATNIAFAAKVDGNDVIKNPAKQFKDTASKVTGQSKRLLIPSLEIRFLWAGDAFAGKNDGFASAHVRIRYAVTGLSKEDLQGMAKTAYDDMVKKYRDAGFEVLTYDDIKADVADVDRWKIEDQDVGMPLYKTQGGETFAIAAPSDEQAFKPALQGYTWTLRKVTKDKDATLLYPVFIVRCPRPQASASKTSTEIKASLGLAPFLAFTAGDGAYLALATAKGGWGAVQLMDWFRMTENAGYSEEVGENSPEFKGKVSWLYKAWVSGFNDDDPKSRSTKKAAFHLIAFRVNKPVYTESVLKFITAFSDVFSRTAGSYKK